MREKMKLSQRLRNSVLLLIIASAGVTEEAPQAVAQGARTTARLEQGQVLTLELNTSIDSESAKVGDHLELQLAQPVINGGNTLLPAGWIVPAHVTRVRHAGKNNCRAGLVAWKLDAAKAPDGTKVRLILLRYRPYGPNGPADKVHVRTAGQEFGRALEDVAIAPFFALEFTLLLPEGLAMAAGEGEQCRGRPGRPGHVLAGGAVYAAVAEDAQVSVVRAPVKPSSNPD